MNRQLCFLERALQNICCYMLTYHDAHTMIHSDFNHVEGSGDDFALENIDGIDKARLPENCKICRKESIVRQDAAGRIGSISMIDSYSTARAGHSCIHVFGSRVCSAEQKGGCPLLDPWTPCSCLSMRLIDRALHDRVYIYAAAMNSNKRSQIHLSHVDPKRRLGKRLGNLFLNNAISAAETGRLFRDAEASGSAHVDHLARVGARRSDSTARHKELLNNMKVNRHWPKQYVLQVPLWNHKEQREEQGDIIMWLPHELLYCLDQKSHDRASLRNRDALEADEEAFLRRAAAFLQVGAEDVISVGLWGDGTPLNRDRTQVVEVLSMNVLSCSSRSDTRFPLCLVQKHLMVKNATWNCIMEVVAWSFRFAAAGVFPSHRHDGSPWHATDGWRARLEGKPCPRAILGQVRGDWAFFKQTLYLPAWWLG